MRKLLIILLFLPLPLFGTNYYVKNGGNDSNTGLSDAQAWATINKVSSISFSPGDSILFKRGNAWDETVSLIISSSGNASNRITYGAYGTGAKPIIRQRPSITGWSTPGNWTQSGGTWYISYAVEIKRLWLSGTEVAQSEALVSIGSSAPYFYDDATERLYIYSATNPASTFTDIETHGGGYPVDSEVTHYITLYNLDLRGGTQTITIAGCDYWIIDSCKVGQDTGNNGLHAYAKIGVHTTSNYGIIRNCIFDTGDRIYTSYQSPSTEDGIRLYYGCNYWEVYNNTVTDWNHTGIYIINLVGGYTTSYNKVYNNYVTAPDIEYGRPVGVDAISGGADSNSVYNNVFTDYPTQIQLNAEGTWFYNNIINNVTGVPYRDEVGVGIALDGYSDCVPQNMVIVNNVIANCEDEGIWIGNDDIDKENNIIANNIIYNCDVETDYQIKASLHSTHKGNNWQNNLIYKSGVSNLINFKGQVNTIAQFNARNGTNGDVIENNIGGDPLFTDAENGDFTLAPGSPAIGAGIDVGLTLDADGNSWDATPSIGAFEYVEEVTPPSTITLLKSNGKFLRHNGKLIKL